MTVSTCPTNHFRSRSLRLSIVAAMSMLIAIRSATAWQTPSETPEPTPAAEVPADPQSDQGAPQPTPADSPQPTPATAPQPTPVANPQPTPADQPPPQSASSPEPTPADVPQPTPADPSQSPNRLPRPIVTVVPKNTQLQQPEPAPPEESETNHEIPTVGSVAVESASFNEIQPGVSTLEDLYEAWGKPAKTSKQKDDTLLVYQMRPFRSVSVQVSANIVRALIIHLDTPMTPEELTKKLRIDNLRSSEVVDKHGEILGRAFPERGVLFNYSTDTQSIRVAQILLEEIQSQSFVLRAENDLDGPYQANLDDLDFAIQLDPRDTRALWLRARVLLAAGQVMPATASINEAIRLEPLNQKYRIVRAKCLAHQGQFDRAMGELDTVLKQDGLPNIVRARGMLLLGDLIAEGPDRDYQEAIKLHTEAIKLANPLASSKLVAVRREAKDILVGAHLSVATDIGWGNWKRKPEVVPKWISRAVAFAEDAIANEGTSEKLWLRVAQRSLRASAGFKPPVDPGTWVDEADKVGSRLLAETDDLLARRSLRWEIGQVYAHALRIEHLRGEVGSGLKYGQLAQAHLEAGAGQRNASQYARVELGQLYFSIGALYAVHKKDHVSAVDWYDKAEPLLTSQETAGPTDPSRLGESLVSMGVSYWEEGLQQKAIELTQQGAKLLETAVKRGAVEKSSLAVPYGNLATMSKQLGDQKKAKDYLELADQSKGKLQR